jgi:serine-type D-Ala-D-Ala carboxypeptidase/endopeptidase
MKLLKITLLVAFLSLNLNYAFAQNDPLNSYIDQLGKEFTTSPEAAGLSIGVLTNDRSYQAHFGTAKKGTPQTPTAQTLYELGSITKVFASTLLAQAVLEHKVKPDDDIRKYLTGEYPNLAYEGKPIMLVHLANLSSGLPNWIPDANGVFQNNKPDAIPDALLAQHRNFTKARFYQELHHVKLTYAPGTIPKHSNAAAQLLGFILEEVYHQPFEQLVKRYITGPLKMQHTGMQPIKSPQLATGYNAAGIPMPYIDTKDFQPSSGLVASTADMLAFLKYQLSQDPAVKMTHQSTLAVQQDTVALNWHTDGIEGGRKTLWHTGGTFGFSSYIVLYPDQQTGIILMANENDQGTQNRLAALATRIIAHMEKDALKP